MVCCLTFSSGKWQKQEGIFLYIFTPRFLPQDVNVCLACFIVMRDRSPKSCYHSPITWADDYNMGYLRVNKRKEPKEKYNNIYINNIYNIYR